jgi:hypothetical protein
MNIVPRYAHITTQTYIKQQPEKHKYKHKHYEINFLYKKKQEINKELHYTHIQNANTWKSVWNDIEQSINKKLQEEMKIIYEKQQQKICNLSKLQKQTENTRMGNENYARVKNTTDTQFTQSEMQLLKKGLKYNLHYKEKNWLETLALEAETAISKINITEQQYYRHGRENN